MDRNTGQRYNDESTEQQAYGRKKYSEKKTTMESHSMTNFTPTYRSCKKEFGERNSKVDLFGDYAETDLDQPTDYSLRYAEDDTDDDEIQSPEYFKDTVKTYCTEGTPYETPFNFSTATSMSDLLLEDTKEPVEPQKKLNKKHLELGRKEELSYERTLSLNGNEDSALLIEKKLETSKVSQTHKSNCLSSQRLVNYYQAEIRNSFSHANSFTSLGTSITQRNSGTGIMSKVPSADSANKMDNGSERADRNVVSSNVNVLHISDDSDCPTDGKNSTRVVDKEGKMVTFSRQDYYAEQTPLMFSRCSSLGSLSGFEQHSIHDDRSSIISDFSRRTSGVVSPSELPDSPTQTIPPSPRNHKNQGADFISKIPEEAVRPSIRHLSYSKCNPPRTSVFEDDIATFKEESTPIEFSTTTSLSSLTIDDNACNVQNDVKEISNNFVKNVKLDSVEEKTNIIETEKDPEQVSDGDDDDEDMLAACISIGIQNNRYRQSFKTSTTQKPIQPEPSKILVRCQRTPILNRLEPSVTVPVTSIDSAAVPPKSAKTAIEVVAAPDTVHVYCTEDTPADISPVGSQSNLSALSMPSVQEDVERIEETKSVNGVECHRNDLSDESSNLSGEDEKILDECIQSGIPKVRQMTPPPTNFILFAQKTGALTQRFNICGTPSSSPVESGNKNTILRKNMCRTTLEHENDLSDDSPNHSDDEAMLSECIRSAMPKVRLNISALMDQSILQAAGKSKVSGLREATSSIYRKTLYLEHNKQQLNKSTPFDDSLSLSEEEEDIMLAQCIKSGMPKALNVSSNTSQVSTKKQEQHSKIKNNVSTYHTRNVIVQNHVAYKPMENYVSLHGGNSYTYHHIKTQENRRYVTKNGGISSYERPNLLTGNCTRKFSQQEYEHSNINESILNASRSEVPNCRSPISNGTDNGDDEPCRNNMKTNVVPSRHSSVSSLSEEGSLGSIEEWALLELCISSGMPRNKYRLKGMKNAEGNTHDERDAIAEDSYSIRSYTSNVCTTATSLNNMFS